MAQEQSKTTKGPVQWFALLFWMALSGLLLAGQLMWLKERQFEAREKMYDELIVNTAAAHGVDPCLVKAVIARESRFNYRAVGAAGEIGLMQIMSGAVQDWQNFNGGREVNRDELFDPRVNIEIGTWYLARGLNQWANRCKDPVVYALAQYNAGRRNLLGWIKAAPDGATQVQSIGYRPTRNYVRYIMKRSEFYRNNGGVKLPPIEDF